MANYTSVYIRRWAMTEHGVFGDLTVRKSGVVRFSCRTLENPWRDNAPFVSCIPSGLYMIERDTFKGKYPNFRITDPPQGRSAIEMHRGNSVDATEGCILLGTRYELSQGELHEITASTEAMTAFMAAMHPDREAVLWITDPVQTYS